MPASSAVAPAYPTTSVGPSLTSAPGTGPFNLLPPEDVQGTFISDGSARPAPSAQPAGAAAGAASVTAAPAAASAGPRRYYGPPLPIGAAPPAGMPMVAGYPPGPVLPGAYQATQPYSYPSAAMPGAQGPMYPGQAYPGQPYPGQPYPGQPFPGQPYPGQPYPGQPYPGQGSPAPIFQGASYQAPVYGGPMPSPQPAPGGQFGAGPPGSDPAAGGPIVDDPNSPGADGPGADSVYQGHFPQMHALWDLFGAGGGLQADTLAGQRYFVRGEALSLWTRGNPVPTLLTTSPLGTPQTEAGVLGQPTTLTLFGNQNVDNGARAAGRVTMGYWFDDMKLRGIEGHYLELGNGSTSYANSQNFSANPDAQILARPFFNVDPSLPHARQDSLVLAYPNFDLLGTPVVLNGTFNVRTTSYMQSAGALYRRMLWMNYDAGYRLDLIGGYRFFRVDDSVSIADSTTTSGGLLATTTFTAQDQFSARNQFQGGEFGLNGQYYWGRLSLDGLMKLGMGNVHETVNISGTSTVSTLGTTVATRGGLLTQPSNIGFYSRNRFGVLPEAQLNLRYDLSPRVRLTVGYTFMYLNRVQHSGTAMDNAVNPTQIGGTLTGPARPAFVWNDTVGWWAQGISTGAEYRW